MVAQKPQNLALQPQLGVHVALVALNTVDSAGKGSLFLLNTYLAMKLLSKVHLVPCHRLYQNL